MTLCLSYIYFLLFFMQWINIDYNKNEDFNHERLNKNSLIIALCQSYLDFLLLLKQWMNINTIKDIDHFNINHERLNKNRNLGHFNFKRERLNNNSLIMTPCLSYLDFLLFCKQWININYNEKYGPF